jgi:multiple sugar transport system permease protein
MLKAWRTYLRDLAAILVVSAYVLPLLWWGLSAFTPTDALLDLRRMLTLDFQPTFANFTLTMLGEGGTVFDSRQSLVDSVIIALLTTLFVLAAALPMAHALSAFTFRHKTTWLNGLLLQRFIPPVTLIFPLVMLYHRVGLIDTHIGVALAHCAANLPFAILLLKSFFDDVPKEVSEAAKLDGATPWQNFTCIVLPMMKSGIAATAVLVFIFSWTEFLISLFLTQNLRTMPVQAGILVMNMWGLISSLTVTALIPAFVFVLLVQRHLVRGLTMGMYK